jgi:hypothetical protein
VNKIKHTETELRCYRRRLDFYLTDGSRDYNVLNDKNKLNLKPAAFYYLFVLISKYYNTINFDWKTF